MKQIRFIQTIEKMTFQLSGILYIGISVLKENYDIPDRRGDPRYESWDRNAEQMRELHGEYEEFIDPE